MNVAFNKGTITNVLSPIFTEWIFSYWIKDFGKPYT